MYLEKKMTLFEVKRFLSFRPVVGCYGFLYKMIRENHFTTVPAIKEFTRKIIKNGEKALPPLWFDGDASLWIKQAKAVFTFIKWSEYYEKRNNL